MMACILDITASLSNITEYYVLCGDRTSRSSGYLSPEYCDVPGVLFKMDVYFSSKTQQTTANCNE
jgi:hypothetical protein